MMKLITKYFILSFIFFNFIFAQTSFYSNLYQHYPQSIFNSSVEKKISNIYWNNNHQYSYKESNFLFKYNLNNSNNNLNYSSNKTKQELLSFTSFINYVFENNFNLGTSINYNYNFDNASKFLNKDKNNTISFLPSYKLNNNSISPIIGYSYQQQSSITNEGINLGWLLENHQPIYLDDDAQLDYTSFYFIEKFQKFDNQYNNHEVNLSFNINNFFINQFKINFYNYNKSNHLFEKDTYYLQKRDDKKFSLFNTMNFEFDNLRVSLNSSYIKRNTNKTKDISLPKTIFDINSNLEETQYLIEPSFTYQANKFNILLKLLFLEKDNIYTSKPQENTELSLITSKRKYDEMNNNISKQYNFISQISYNFTPNNQLTILFVNNKFQYDTPSDLNFDDRDELQQILNLSFKSKLSKQFYCKTYAEIGQDIFSYIKSQKSSYNYTSKKIKFGFSTYFASNQIINRSLTEVFTTYTIMKYSQNNNDFIIRQYSFEDSLKINFGTIFDIILLTNLRINELGGLDWRLFRMFPQRKIYELFYNPLFSFKLDKNNSIYVGLKNYYSHRYVYSNNSYKKEYDFKNLSPNIGIIYSWDKIKFDSNFEYENNYYQKYKTTNINYSLTIRMLLN